MTQPIRYITPAVTPLLPDGKIDLDSAESLYRHLVGGGMDGILIFGSIGEFFGFTPEQKKELIRRARKVIGRETQLIVGTTSMIFDEMVELSNYALAEGADAVMILPPYYFWFNETGVFSYYDQLAQAIHGNIYIYNFPERSGYTITPQVLRALAEKHPNIVGVKDTVPGVDHTREVIKAVRPVRPDFIVYSGFDDNLAHNVLCGGNGCISGMSNLFPRLAASWAQALREGDFAKSQELQQRTDSLMDVYSVGYPFIPAIKEGLVQLGVLKYATATRPMPALTAEEKERLKAIMARCVVE